MGRMKAGEGYEYPKEVVKVFDRSDSIEFTDGDFVEAA